MPRLDRLGIQRRVLGFVTNEKHLGRARNTAAVLDEDLGDDPHSPYTAGVDDVQVVLDELEAAGLVVRRADGTYAVTELGRVELREE